MKYLIRAAVCSTIICSPFLLAAQAQSADRAAPIPDFTGTWARQAFDLERPPSGPGPIQNTRHRPSGIGSNIQVLVGDYTNPILKPEAAESVKRMGQIYVSGGVPPDASNQCLPMSPPLLVGLIQEIQVLQQKDHVTIVYMWDHAVRRIRLNGTHPTQLAPSWHGDSIGHYEGDTLVVDTVGIKVGPLAIIDRYGSPQTEALHVVERYRVLDYEAAKAITDQYEAEQGYRNAGALSDGVIVDPNYIGKGLQVSITIEDPNVFTTPWTGQATYRRAGGEWQEQSCAENTREAVGRERKMPVAERPDF